MDGKTTYASMIGAGDLTPDMQSKMRALAERTEGMKGALSTMRQQVATDLRDELALAVSGLHPSVALASSYSPSRWRSRRWSWS